MSKHVDQLTPEQLVAKRAYDRQYNALKRERNSPAQKAADKKYRENNREKRRERDRIYAAANSAQKVAAAQRWVENNRARYRLRHRADFHRRKARVLASNGTWSAEQFQAVCAAQSWACSYCGAITSDLQPDHMTPLARGGSNDIENITPACQRCNYRRGSKTAEEFRAWVLNFGY